MNERAVGRRESKVLIGHRSFEGINHLGVRDVFTILQRFVCIVNHLDQAATSSHLTQYGAFPKLSN